jgi:hypothetical protein
MTKLTRNRWTSAEIEQLRKMKDQPIAAIVAAFPKHTPWSVKYKRTELTKASPNHVAKRWLRICAAHKPRIILAAPFPAAREVMQ